MTKGPRRLVLDQYLDTASEGTLKGAGANWTQKAKDLDTLGAALKKAAQQAELRIGEQTLSGPAVRASMEVSATSLDLKSAQLHAAGAALTQVGQQLSDTRDSRDALADLGPKPSPYQAPAGTPGVEPTAEEIQAQADASQARSNERSAWQTQYDKQEAKALALTKEMDAAFLAAIPPMKEIHGQKDPTEPPPNVPAGPGRTYLPGTQAPPVTGGGDNDGGNGGNKGTKDHGGVLIGGPVDNDDDDDKDVPVRPVKPVTPVITTCFPNPVETPITYTPPTGPTGTEGPTTTVSGSSQSGISYQPTGSQVSAPVTGAAAGGVGGAGGAATAAAFGAAGGAGAMSAGSVRPGAPASATRGATPVRAIGSTGKAGSAGAISRAAGSAGSPATRGSSAGSTAGRGSAGSAGSSAGRGASSGSTAGRGSAGARAGGATGAAGSQGSRSGGRGSSGARGAAGGVGAGRGGRKGERDQTTDRDRLVYDQDWLGDDDVAPGVLD